MRHQLFLEIAFGPLSLNAPGFRGYIYITSRFRHLSPGNITLIRSHEIARGRRDSIEVAEQASETGNELRGALSCNRVRFYRSTTTLVNDTRNWPIHGGYVEKENRIERERGERLEDWEGKREKVKEKDGANFV